MRAQLFFKDTAGELEITDPNGTNIGMFSRYEFTSEGKSFNLESPLMHDLFQMKRYILNQVDVQVKLYRSNPQFMMLATKIDTAYVVQIEDIVLKVMQICVKPGMIWGHNEALSTTPAKYPFRRTEVKMFSIVKGQTSFAWDNIFQGIRPNKVVVGFVSAKGTGMGDFHKNPYNFANWDLSQIALFCDGTSVGESGPMKLHFGEATGQTIIPAYVNLFRSSGCWSTINNIETLTIVDITRDEFVGGYALYVFSLDPVFGHNDGTYLRLQKRGTLRLEAQFRTPLPETVSSVVYAEFDDIFETEKSRNIIG
ncbi:uncharacterized protein F54H12.2-like [Haliotis rubra]|uniref:uncharacterized protein F54H12.2-like n=1 Tax=Haliotis rubra TaxID=36100 RepID=UPI001EE60A74|nr:uncharacterized protein F54H12.2-like [Haliotis rubra]